MFPLPCSSLREGGSARSPVRDTRGVPARRALTDQSSAAGAATAATSASLSSLVTQGVIALPPTPSLQLTAASIQGQLGSYPPTLLPTLPPLPPLPTLPLPSAPVSVGGASLVSGETAQPQAQLLPARQDALDAAAMPPPPPRGPSTPRAAPNPSADGSGGAEGAESAAEPAAR